MFPAVCRAALPQGSAQNSKGKGRVFVFDDDADSLQERHGRPATRRVRRLPVRRPGEDWRASRRGGRRVVTDLRMPGLIRPRGAPPLSRRRSGRPGGHPDGVWHRSEGAIDGARRGLGFPPQALWRSPACGPPSSRRSRSAGCAGRSSAPRGGRQAARDRGDRRILPPMEEVFTEDPPGRSTG